MATKDAILKKQMIKEGVIAATALVLLVVGGMTLSNYDDDAQSEKRIKENENSNLTAQHDAIRQQLGTGFEVNAFYETYIRNHSSDLTLKRDIATQWMTAMREKNHLSDLSVTIAPIVDASTEIGPLKSGTMVKSDVKLSFGGVTDNSVYGFIEALERKLPGFVLVHDIKINRTADPSRNMLVDLSQHKLTPLVTGELSFDWVGIRPTEADKVPPSSPANGVGNGSR